MKTSVSFLPTKGLPATPYPANGRVSWISPDSEENYRKNRARTLYSDQDIEYKFNDLGYRCPDFDSAADIKIVAVGCSYVMGIGLPVSDLFHEQFAIRLRSSSGRSVIVWNLGILGASNDVIARMLHLAVPVLDPDIVLINFSHANRRDYVSVHGKWMPYVEGYIPSDATSREIKRHFDALCSPFDDELNVFRNYKSIESLLSDRFWLFSSMPSLGTDPFDRIQHHIDPEHQVGRLQTIDLARDCTHPGKKSHQILADQYWKHFCAQDGLRLIS